MRGSAVLAGVLLLACVCSTAFAAGSLRETDFRNHTFPWLDDVDSWQDDLEWISGKPARMVRLRNGVWPLAEIEPDFAAPGAPFGGLTFDSAIYGDLLGDEREEAVVILRYDTGGTMYWYFVYVFASVSGRPEVVAWFHSGDRAARGLHELRVEAGELVVELYDPAKQQGDCCSAGIERRRFRWSRGAFLVSRKTEFADAKRTSRRRASLFGTPVE